MPCHQNVQWQLNSTSQVKSLSNMLLVDCRSLGLAWAGHLPPPMLWTCMPMVDPSVINIKIYWCSSIKPVCVIVSADVFHKIHISIPSVITFMPTRLKWYSVFNKTCLEKSEHKENFIFSLPLAVGAVIIENPKIIILLPAQECRTMITWSFMGQTDLIMRCAANYQKVYEFNIAWKLFPPPPLPTHTHTFWRNASWTSYIDP